jgi:DNA invertase Pin-like site-specific DNA recombinase
VEVANHQETQPGGDSEKARLVGYGRVSTQDQDLGAQRKELLAAGCTLLFEEKASGGDRDRAELTRAIEAIRPGDTLVVTKIDRLARSVIHLLEIVETLYRRGSFFRSLNDPIATTGPTGRLTLSILGAVAEFERGIGKDRTISGLLYARGQGRVGGNPAIRARDKDAIREIQAKRSQTRLENLSATADTWLPIVQRLRPKNSWATVLEKVNQGRQADPFTETRLKRAVAAFVKEGLAPKSLLGRADRRPDPKKSENRIVRVRLVAAIKSSKEDITLLQIGAELVRLKEMPTGGGKAWSLSTIKGLVDEGKALGLITPRGAPAPDTLTSS